jgi:hypothetical protein
VTVRWRLYLDTIDRWGRNQREGPYEFHTSGEALDWLRNRNSPYVQIVGTELWHGEEKIAEAK